MIVRVEIDFGLTRVDRVWTRLCFDFGRCVHTHTPKTW